MCYDSTGNIYNVTELKEVYISVKAKTYNVNEVKQMCYLIANHHLSSCAAQYSIIQTEVGEIIVSRGMCKDF